MNEPEALPALGVSRSRAHDVADYLTKIISSTLAPGDRLGTKDRIRQLTGVSVSTVNEATRLLEERGVISMRPGPNGGIFAASPPPVVKVGQLLVTVRDDPERYSEAAAVRDALEPLIVSDAVQVRSEADIADLHRLLQLMSESESEVDRFLRADLALHERIAEISSRHLVTNIYLMVLGVQIEQLESTVVDELPPLSHTHERLLIHQALVDGIAEQNLDMALTAVRQHSQPVSPVESGQIPQ